MLLLRFLLAFWLLSVVLAFKKRRGVLVSSLLLSPCVCFFRFFWVGLLVELSSAGDLKQTHSYILLYSVRGIYFFRACWFLLYCSLLVFVSSGFVVIGLFV